jgi:glycosyltransferase involved in cell wall biosynthesis
VSASGRRPRLVLDLRMVEGHMHGIARYALALAARLPALLPEMDVLGLIPPSGLPPLGDLTPTLPVQRCAARFLSPFEQPALAMALLKARADCFAATSFSVPLFWPGRLAATLHDATHLVRADEFGPATALYYRAVVRPRLRRAQAILTVSKFAKAELIQRLGLPETALHVVPDGVDARFSVPAASSQAEARRRLGLPKAYLLAVGNAKPHKALGWLAALASRLPWPLVVLAGPDAQRLQLPQGVLGLQEVAEELLPAVYAGAQALLLPSVHEGFGLPALEAFACGCPVVAADAAALPEVVGDAGLLVAPKDAEAWVSAVQRLHDETGLRQELQQRGLVRAQSYSWDSCAQRTADVYREALR